MYKSWLTVRSLASTSCKMNSQQLCAPARTAHSRRTGVADAMLLQPADELLLHLMGTSRSRTACSLWNTCKILHDTEDSGAHNWLRLCLHIASASGSWREQPNVLLRSLHRRLCLAGPVANWGVVALQHTAQ